MSKDNPHSHGIDRRGRERNIRWITATEKCKTATLISSTKEWPTKEWFKHIMGEYGLRRSWKVFLGKGRLRFKGRKEKN